MIGEELINYIKKNELEDFELKFSFTDGFDVFPNRRSFKITEIADVGYSDKAIILDGEEQ